MTLFIIKMKKNIFKLYLNSYMYDDLVRYTLSLKANELIGILDKIEKTKNFLIIKKIILCIYLSALIKLLIWICQY